MMSVSPLARAPAAAATGKRAGVIRGRVIRTDGRSRERRLSGSASSSNRASDGERNGRSSFRSRGRIVPDRRDQAGFPAPGEPISFGPQLPTVGLASIWLDGETRTRRDHAGTMGHAAGHVFDELGDPLQGVSACSCRRCALPAADVLPPRAARHESPTISEDSGSTALRPAIHRRATVGDVASADLPGYTRCISRSRTRARRSSSRWGSCEYTGVDFMSRTQTALVAGTLISAAGELTTGGSVKLMPSLLRPDQRASGRDPAEWQVRVRTSRPASMSFRQTAADGTPRRRRIEAAGVR